MTDDGWARLRDGKTYKIYDTGYDGWLDRLFRIARYTVVKPNGGVLGCRSSLRAANRLIEKDRTKPDVAWWDAPIVREVPRG